jgi:hypothetical protein
MPDVTRNKGKRPTEAERELGAILSMADPTVAGYVARHEALLQRVAKLERALEIVMDRLDNEADSFGRVPITGDEIRTLIE